MPSIVAASLMTDVAGGREYDGEWTISPLRTVTSATLTTVVGMLPVFLVGASGVFIRRELGFAEVGLGLCVAIFMGVSASSAIYSGRIAERIGAGRSLSMVGIGSGLTMLAIALLVHDLSHLAVLSAIGGLCNSMAQPAGNLAMARGVKRRAGLMFGIRQSAVPVATLLAGASIPLVSISFGWRTSFVLGAVASFIVAAVIPQKLAPPSGLRRGQLRSGDASTGPLIAMAIAFGLGMSAALAMASFLVESLVAQGVASGAAGWLLVAGSISGVVCRVAGGLMSDRHPTWTLYTVAVMLALGSVGYVVMAMGNLSLVPVGILLAYGAGFGWGGLVFLATVRLNPNAPAAATGIVSAGGASGAALGPLLFGYIVTGTTYEIAWLVASLVALLAAAQTLFARSLLLRDRDRRMQIE
jgi:MFS family permease